ncbi:MAG: winged helix DNA-binding protein [Protaetiibacter sp.]
MIDVLEHPDEVISGHEPWKRVEQIVSPPSHRVGRSHRRMGDPHDATGSVGGCFAERGVVVRVRSLVLDLNAALTECFRPLGLSCVQAEALLALRATGPTTLTQLSGNLVAESGHPSRLISRLVDRGLVERAPSATDGRAVVLSLTHEGQLLAAKADEARTPLVDAVASRHDAELAGAVTFLRSLRDTLGSGSRSPSDGG